MNPVILIADFGSSNVRVHAIDATNGEIVAQHAVKYPLISPQDGFFELDPQVMWRNSVACVREVMGQLGDAAQVKALSFSHIGASLVPMDSSFQATYHCIVGMDSRAGEEAAELERQLRAQGPLPATSFTFSDVSPMAKVMYLRKYMPDVAAKSTYYVSIQQYILKCLGLPLVWDATEAGSHSCFDVLKREWSLPVLEAVGIAPASLGAVVQSHDTVGKITRYGDVAFAEAVPVVIGGHDAVMGTIGLGVYDEADDAVAEVTGSVDVFCFLMNSAYHFTQEQQAGVREGSLLMCEPGPVRDSTMILSGYKTAGALIEWFLREMYPKDGGDAFADLWSKTVFDGKGSVTVQPNFVNGGGGIMGLDLSVTKYDVYRACIEALTYENRILLENCMKIKNGACNRVRIGGGHASADAWVQFRADVTGKTYERMVNNEASALGTAVLAAYGVGLYPTLEDTIHSMVRVRDRFTPDARIHAVYDALFQRYIGR